MMKRGAGHVEAILSFILFIGFVMTALVFFLPSGTQNIMGASLMGATSNILSNASVDFESYSVKINKENIPSSQRTIAINFPESISSLSSNYKVRAESYDGMNLPASREGNKVFVDFGNEEFVVIKFSEDMQEGSQAQSRPPENSAQYIIASSSKRKIISEQRLLALNQSYYTSYDVLKSNLGIPNSISFGFSVQFPNMKVVAERNVPEGLEVFSSVSRRELLLQRDGALVFGEVNVRVW